MQVSKPPHRPQDRTQKFFPDFNCQAIAIRNILSKGVGKRAGPDVTRGIQELLMAFRAAPRFTIRASNYPLGARVWAFQGLPLISRVAKQSVWKGSHRCNKPSRVPRKKIF
jgi:hypothetical protein